MAVLTNKNGTASADTLTYTTSGTYSAGAGNDTINIKGGSIVAYLDAGSNIINVTGGSSHTVKVATTDAACDKVNGADKLIINGSDIIDAHLGSGKDEITLNTTNGRKSNGALSQIRGGAWGDTFTTNIGAQKYQLYGDAGDDIFNIKGGDNLVFWGGAANDTFNVTGGTNLKLRGGDSADTYNVSVAKVDIQLGYGNDVVNITAGDSQQIKGNLGINTINLKAGAGHVIIADIDQALSKKKGYTQEQINKGIGLGYGQDKVYITGTATKVTANLGDGRDCVSVTTGSGHNINTEGWTDTIEISGTTSSSSFNAGAGNDIITVTGGNNNTIAGGAGNDTYNITWTKGKRLTINNADSVAAEKDTFNFTNMSSNDFQYTYDATAKKLTLTDSSSGTITILSNAYLRENVSASVVNFANKTTSIKALIDNTYAVAIPNSSANATVNSSKLKNGNLMLDSNASSVQQLTFAVNSSNLKISSEKTGGSVTLDSTALAGLKTISIDGNNYTVKRKDQTTNNNYSSSTTGVLVVGQNTSDVDITGSKYNDFIQLSTSNDTVFSNAGDDIVKIVSVGGNVPDTVMIRGEKGNDYLASMAGTGHSLFGDEGNDTLVVTNQSGRGVDLDGGAGNDKYIVDLGFVKGAATNTGIVTINQSDAAAGDADVLVLTKASKANTKFSLVSGVLSISSTNGSSDAVYVLDWSNHALDKIYLGTEASKSFVTGSALKTAFAQTSSASMTFGDGSVATYSVSYDSTSGSKTLVITGSK